MARLTDAGAIIAGGAALGMLTNAPYGDVDYYIGVNDYQALANVLKPHRVLVDSMGEHTRSYLMVTTWNLRLEESDLHRDEYIDFTKRKHKPITEMPTKVEHPELYRLASGLNPAPPLKFQSTTTPINTSEPLSDYWKNTIDVIPTPDDDPRDFVAREFDLSVCKVYIGRGGKVYAMYPNDIRLKRVSQIFDRRMTYNKSKLGTLELRLKKYIERGYEYYEYSRLYKLNIPCPFTFGHGISDDAELGRLIGRVRASTDFSERTSSPFMWSFRRALMVWVVVHGDCNSGLPPAYVDLKECGRVWIPDYAGFVPTPDDIELAHAMFRFYPPIKYRLNDHLPILFSHENISKLATYNPGVDMPANLGGRVEYEVKQKTALHAQIHELNMEHEKEKRQIYELCDTALERCNEHYNTVSRELEGRYEIKIRKYQSELDLAWMLVRSAHHELAQLRPKDRPGTPLLL